MLNENFNLLLTHAAKLLILCGHLKNGQGQVDHPTGSSLVDLLATNN